jgi:hypothetical protein
MKILFGGLLVLSLALNVFLWSRFSAQQNELKSLQASASEVDELRRQNQELQSSRASAQAVASGSDVQELARLRNEVGQLRKQAAETESLRAQAAEAAQLRAELAATKRGLADAEGELAEAVKIPPEQLQALKQEAQSAACINNMKQIGIAARLWAQDNEGVFPPNLAVMKLELVTPKILFCPAAPGGVQATDWAQLNPSTISYQYLNPNGTPNEPQKVLTTCPIHGHIGRSDGSVEKPRQ